MLLKISNECPQNEDVLNMLRTQFEALKTLDGKAVDKNGIPQVSGRSLNNEYRRSTVHGSNNGMNVFFGGVHECASRLSLPRKSVDVRTLIAKEMLQYNLEERNALLEEIHGVRSISKDESPPDMLDNALEELKKALRALPPEKKVAYEKSQEYSETYVNERNFRLRFLRAELFDAKKAATRLSKFLETGLEFFGSQVLVRPVRLSDFSRKEMKVFNIGRIQLLPYRDRSGRRVVVGIPAHDHLRQEARTRAKIHFYLWWVASESVESQRRGIVFITIHNPALSDCTTEAVSTAQKNGMRHDGTQEQQQEISGLPSMQFAKLCTHRRDCLPVRMSAFHLCTPDSPFYSVLQNFTTAILSGERCRIKVHVGHDMENRYKLNGYGIPLDQLPITETGKIKTTYFKKWIQFRRNLEDPYHELNWKKELIVECPGLADVVFRPGQSTLCHPGNVTFRSLVEARHYEHSNASSRERKTFVTYEVLREIQERGGRFLAWENNGCWVEITDEKQIYSKIAVFFRNSKVSAKAKRNNQVILNSSTYAFAGANEKRRKIDSEDEDSSCCTSNCISFIGL